MSNKPIRNPLLVRSFKIQDCDKILDLEASFGKIAWKELEAFLGPSRFLSVLEDNGKIVGYQVTYCTLSGEFRAKVLLTKGYEGKEFFEFLMKPTFVKHGANMKIDSIKVREDKNDKRIRESKSGIRRIQEDDSGFPDTEPFDKD